MVFFSRQLNLEGFFSSPQVPHRVNLLSVYLVSFSIFVAFILEAFMLEYSFTHGKIETVISKKIEEKGIGVGM